MNQTKLHPITELRIALNLSQDELGKILGIDQSHVSRVESKNKNKSLSVRTLKKIIKLADKHNYQIDLHKLINES